MPVETAFPGTAATFAARRDGYASRAIEHPGSAAFTTARIVLTAALVLATLAFGAVQAWAWATLTALVALATVAWALASVRRGVVQIAWSPLYLPPAIFLVVGVIQFLAHVTADPIATRESLLKLATDLLVFFLAVNLWQDEAAPSRRRFALGAALFAGALALFAILQFFASSDAIYGIVKPRWGGWIFGPYVNHNDYAGLMEMLIPIAVSYVVSLRALPPRSPGSALAAFAALVATASLLLSGSRGGLVSLIVEIVVWALLLWKYFPGASRRRWAGAGLLGLAAASALFLWLDPGRLWKRLGSVADLPRAPEATLGERRIVAHDTLRIFLKHPWLGTGLGSFGTVYPQYRSFASDVDWDHAHDDYAEALAETGIGGGLALVAGLGMFLFLAFKNLRERLHRGAGWIALGAAVGCCGLLVHSLVDFNLHIPANAAWFSLCAGMAVSQGPSRRVGEGRR